MDLTLPRDLGRYRLLRELGRGGFGTVYEATLAGPLGFIDRVALKLVTPKVAGASPDILHALADEARLLSRLRHPHIVQLRGFERIDDPEFGTVHGLVLEFVDGTTLSELVTKAPGWPALSMPEVLYVISMLLNALEVAHDARSETGEILGLVHRDLKPQNVMLDRSGSLRLLDFGIAWATERLVKTGIGLTKGSPPYMSPEQVLGQPLTNRSDLYVVGVNMFDMLAPTRWVEPPTTARQIAVSVRSIVNARFDQRADELRAGLRSADGFAVPERQISAVLSLVGSLLERHPKDRPNDARAVTEALRQLDDLRDDAAARRALARRVEQVTGTVGSREPPVAPTRPMVRPTKTDELDSLELDGGPMTPAAFPPRAALRTGGGRKAEIPDTVDMPADAGEDWLRSGEVPAARPPDIGSLPTRVVPTEPAEQDD